MEKIIACIDGSVISSSVCDAAAWVSVKLEAPLKLLHVLEKTNTPVKEDLSGAIGFGSRESLLDELIALDEKRGKLALEHGKHMLEDAKTRAEQQGANNIILQQRHGSLLETLTEFESETRLFVMGRLGEDHDMNSHTIGSHVENVVRSLATSILVTVGRFTQPDSFMIAYDGSETADRAIGRISQSPLLKGLVGHIVMVAPENQANVAHLQDAATLLNQNGHEVSTQMLQGDVLSELEKYRAENNIGLMVMGAYGHSRMREFFVGSNTSKMIGNSAIPLLLLR